MRARVRLLLLVAVLALGPAQAVGQQMDLARLAFRSGWNALPAIVAIERGFFAQEGVVVSALPLPSEEALVNSLAGGTTEFATVSQGTFLRMAAAGAPVKAVSINNWGPEMALVVPADDTATAALEDLRGKSVAVGGESIAYPVLIRLLNANRIRLSEVTVKPLSADRLVAAFANREADAVFEQMYFLSPLLDSGEARVVIADSQVVETLGVIAAEPLIVSDSMIAEEPATVQKFVNAWVKALVYIGQAPDDVAQLLQIYMHRQGTSVPIELAKRWVALQRYDRRQWSEHDIADAEYNAWALKQAQRIGNIPELAPSIDNRFVEQAWARLQG